MLASGASPKTTRNALVQAHGHLAFAVKRGWAAVNPAAKVDLPRVEPSVEIRFLDAAELAALYRACPDTPLGRTNRMLYRVAAMAGLRLGELIALRWRDIDFPAGTIRVRQTFVRGEWSTPKSRRGARAVPMADALAGALELHYQASRYQGDDALVLCHPDSGGVLDGSALRRRFKAAPLQPDLKGGNLSAKDLSGMYLSGKMLEEANLREANLSGAISLRRDSSERSSIAQT